MEVKPVSLFVVAVAAVIVLSVFVDSGEAQGICYRQQSSRSGYYYYRRAYYSYSYRCGWWGWSRCRRTVAYSRRVYGYRTSYYRRFGCCSGYYQSGTRCYPICNPSCSNGGSCIGPNNCRCPSTWTGSGCRTDVNECTLNRDNCAHNCINTNGGYRCSCRPGYNLLSNGYSCGDVNECASNNGGCDHNCHNNLGSFTCSCQTGYSLSSNRRSCIDINECTINNGGCQHGCTNTAGSFSCNCRTGYALNSDGRTCRDVNECLSNNGGCAHICNNNVGSYSCACRAGYSLNSDGRGCSDINECALGTDRCAQNCQNTIGSYTCSCNTGYRLNSNGYGCDDIDECREGTHQCSQNCHNTVGTYTCSCNTGYRLNSNGRGCDDIDECQEGTDQCAQNCHNTVGTYTCSCNIGYRLNVNGFGCDDVNECTEGTHQCAQNCINNVGSYTCSCRVGYRLNADARRCDDIDECAEGTDQCGQNCHNNVGSYTCSCNTGYRLNVDGFRCDDIDECAEGTNTCDQNCHNNVGSYTCSCNIGYRLNSDGRRCYDIDECAEGTETCEHNCHNLIGSYNCSCYIGYRLNADQRACDDINECAENTDMCAQNCHNNIGSYNCSCNIGYRLNVDGFGCDDIDECVERTDTCDQNCHNNIGSYNCSCEPGYRLAPDQRTCLDVDECALGTDRCDQNCHNNVGSYTCSCNTGYRINPNGYTCDDINECLEQTDGCEQICNNTVGSYFCQCRIGYRLNTDIHTCSDIDECMLGTDQCEHNCHNAIGTYTCSCNTGFMLNPDGFRCDDINECMDGGIGATTCGQLCNNTIGSYFCSCLRGYRLDPDAISCSDIDECSNNTSGCEQNCLNTPGSFTCSCNTGYEIESDNRRCRDVDECALGISGCLQNCTNTLGSFNCSCFSGYRLTTDGRFCNDIDECTEDQSICEQNCMNTAGSFTCRCNQGYVVTRDGRGCLGPPIGVLQTPATSTSLSVTWTAPLIDQRHGTIQSFTLIFQSSANPSFFQQQMADAGDRQFTMTGLQPYTPYTCCITIVTDTATSPHTCVDSTTLQDVPGSNPLDFTFVTEGPYSIAAQWQPPEPANGELLGYNLYVTFDNDTSKVIMLAATELEYVLNGLSPYQQVSVSATAKTSAGEGPNTTAYYAVTDETPPSAIDDTHVTVTAPTESALIIRWTAPDHANGPVIRYIVNISNEQVGLHQSRTFLPTEDLQWIVDILQPTVPYTVTIQAVNSAGISVSSPRVLFTQEGTPDVPQITGVLRRTGTAAIISWTPITYTSAKGYLTTIDLVYRASTTSDCSDLDLTKNADDVTFTPEDFDLYNVSSRSIDGLQADKEYCVAMRASNAAGTSAYSMPDKAILQSSSDFQARFNLGSQITCQDFIKADQEMKIQVLKDSISAYVSANCSCLFTSNYIVDATLNCEEPVTDEVILVAGILSSGDTNSTYLRDNTVQNYLNSMDGKMLKVTGYNLTLNSYCSPVVFDKSHRCLAQNGSATVASATAAGRVALKIGIYVAIGAGAGLFVCALMVIAAMGLCICCSRRAVRTKYKESNNGGFHVQNMGAADQRTSAFPPQYTTAGTFNRGATTTGYSNSTLTKKGTIPRNGKGTLPRDGTVPQKIVSNYTPSYEPNPSTLEMKRPEKNKSSTKVVNSYIDDGDEDFDYLNY